MRPASEQSNPTVRTTALRGLQVAVLVVALVVCAVPAASAKNKATLDSFENAVFQKLNQTRVSHGLVPLRLSTRLTTASNAHSVEMADDGYFDHSSRDGTPFWKRVDQWYGSSGYRFWSVGENLLWASPSLTPDHAIAMWMASPEHRANILNAQWREIGIAAVHLSNAPGVYHGLPGDRHHDGLRRPSLSRPGAAPGSDRSNERLDAEWIELAARAFVQFAHCRLLVDALPVGPFLAHRQVRVGDRNDAGRQRNVDTREPGGVAGAVPALVMRADDLGDPGLHGARDDPLSLHRVLLDLAPLGASQRPGLRENAVVDAQLADIV